MGQAVFLRPKKFDGKGGILYVSVAKGRCGPFFFCTPVSKLPPLCQASTNKRIYYILGLHNDEKRYCTGKITWFYYSVN